MGEWWEPVARDCPKLVHNIADSREWDVYNDDGEIDWHYTGLASKEDGLWVVKGGCLVDYDTFNGTYDWKGKAYHVENSHVLYECSEDSVITVVYHFPDGSVVPDSYISGYHKKEVSKDENGNVVGPVKLSLSDLWVPIGYSFAYKDYLIDDYLLSDGTVIWTAEEGPLYATDVSPYINNGVLDVYLKFEDR